MDTNQLAKKPLWDAEREEPYIPLPSHPDLRLTPWRVTDGPAAVSGPFDPL